MNHYPLSVWARTEAGERIPLLIGPAASRRRGACPAGEQAPPKLYVETDDGALVPVTRLRRGVYVRNDTRIAMYSDHPAAP